MSYREKSSWLALMAMIVTLIPFFIYVAYLYLDQRPINLFCILWLYAASVVVRLALLGGGELLLRFAHKEEARLPRDERDLAIEQKAMSYPYYILMIGTIIVGCILPFSLTGVDLMVRGLFVIVLAEFLRVGMVVVGYRLHS